MQINILPTFSIGGKLIAMTSYDINIDVLGAALSSTLLHTKDQDLSQRTVAYRYGLSWVSYNVCILLYTSVQATLLSLDHTMMVFPKISV